MLSLKHFSFTFCKEKRSSCFRHLTHFASSQSNSVGNDSKVPLQSNPSVSSYYKVNNQSAIDTAAGKVIQYLIKNVFFGNHLILISKPSVRLTPYMILYSGKSHDGSHLLVGVKCFFKKFKTYKKISTEKCTVFMEGTSGENCTSYP